MGPQRALYEITLESDEGTLVVSAPGVHREQVDRLFRLDHQSKLDQLEEAYKALGAPLRIEVPFPAAA